MKSCDDALSQLGERLNMGKSPDGVGTLRLSARSSSPRLSGSTATVLHYYEIMEALVLVAAMTLSGLLALGGTRAVLGVVMLVFMRDDAGR